MLLKILNFVHKKGLYGKEVPEKKKEGDQSKTSQWHHSILKEQHLPDSQEKEVTYQSGFNQGSGFYNYYGISNFLYEFDQAQLWEQLGK